MHMKKYLGLLASLCLSLGAQGAGSLLSTPSGLSIATPSLFVGCVDFWGFDETVSGTRYSSTSNRTALTDASILISDGVIGKCLGNTDGTLRSVYADYLYPSGYVYTSSIWVKYTAWSPTGGPNQVAFWHGNNPVYSANIGFQQAWDGSRYVQNAVTMNFIGSNNGMALNTWFLTTIVKKDNRTFDAYTNGVYSTTYTHASDLANNTSGTSLSLTTAPFNLASHSIDGMVDEFVVWKRALSASEIKAYYNSGKSKRFPFNSYP